ncbi:MAG: zinc ABC transporter solute-binding protein [Bacteroidales bacterium]|jgi:zinc transport system substrate-binding protein|nr:zinc ABC transporter solute-binding protein [Bacteroidales bacterium]
MQKYLSILSLSLLLLACNSATKNKDAAQERVVTVTIEPQRFFLELLAGDEYSINTLVPPGTSPETYEPSPSVMIEMGKSDIYFRVGELGFEKVWSSRLEQNNPDVAIVDCSAGIDLMEGELHRHDHDHADQAGDGHSHTALDPHVWTSPGAMSVFTKNMLEALVKADPVNEPLYRSNYEILTHRINVTDSTIRALLQDASTDAFIIFHPALGYFARDYGLHQYSIEFEGKNPSPSQIRELIDLARKEKINTVFIQRGFDAKNAEVIAKEIDAELFEIDPMSYKWDEELIKIATILSRHKDE